MYPFCNHFQTLQSASVMLIDTGETLKVSALPKTGLYKLSKKAQSLPAFAIPCKAAKVMSFKRDLLIQAKIDSNFVIDLRRQWSGNSHQHKRIRVS